MSAFIRSTSRCARAVAGTGLAVLLAVSCSSDGSGRTGATAVSPLPTGASAERRPPDPGPTSSAPAESAPIASAAAPSMSATDVGGDDRLPHPIRAAFYYPWYPEAWSQDGLMPFTQYTPSDGLYDSSDPGAVLADVDAMRYAGLDAGIASWWGPGTATDGRFPLLMELGAERGFAWAPYVEREGVEDPSVAEIAGDVRYLVDSYGSSPAVLRVGGRMVVFVYADGGDGCDMAERWVAGAGGDVVLVLKVFPGYLDCAVQPDGWHQYGPASAIEDHSGFSVTVSPGFWKAGESEPRLARDPERFRADVHRMAASGAQWQLVTTYNEWGEGTAVESATDWASSSGFGLYLDILHDELGLDS